MSTPKSSSPGGTNTFVPEQPKAVDVAFREDELVVRLEDGRTLSAPIAWFPTLANATEAQRSNWELIGQGIGIHWPGLDEDLSVAGLLGLPD